MEILVIEDNYDHFFLIKDHLLESMPLATIHHETEIIPGLHALHNQHFSVCLCDLSLPNSPINTTIERIKNVKACTPIIVLTSLNNIDVAKEMLKIGVQDYLPKDEMSPTLLHRTCMYAIERKQQQVAIQQKNADMQVFTASLSHDFKSHIRRIIQQTHFLKNKLSDSMDLLEDDMQIFQQIEDSASGINDIADGLRDFLVIDYAAENSEETDLNTIVSKIKDTIISTTKKDVAILLNHKLPIINANKFQLTILFTNVITNGIKYNERKPLIEIFSETTENGHKIIVKDNGIGIERKFFHDILSPFKRLHTQKEYPGSGLGLSIVKRIMDRHQGSIEIQSELGIGSSFIFHFPTCCST